MVLALTTKKSNFISMIKSKIQYQNLAQVTISEETIFLIFQGSSILFVFSFGVQSHGGSFQVSLLSQGSKTRKTAWASILCMSFILKSDLNHVQMLNCLLVRYREIDFCPIAFLLTDLWWQLNRERRGCRRVICTEGSYLLTALRLYHGDGERVKIPIHKYVEIPTKLSYE